MSFYQVGVHVKVCLGRRYFESMRGHSSYRWFSETRINRIYHLCSVGTGKPQPEGPPFQWEMRLAEFPTGTMNPRVGIFPVDTEHQLSILFRPYRHRIVLRMCEHGSVNGKCKKKK